MAETHQNTFQIAPINNILVESCPKIHRAGACLQFIIIIIISFQFKILLKYTLKLNIFAVKNKISWESMHMWSPGNVLINRDA